MAAIQEQAPRESLPELPQTELGKLVTACAEEALGRGRKTLLIERERMEPYRGDVKNILQFCGYSGTDLVRGRRLSKKPDRNLGSAVQEILYHDPRFQGRFIVISRETREQRKPHIPAQLVSISLKPRYRFPRNLDPDVDCKIELVSRKRKKAKKK